MEYPLWQECGNECRPPENPAVEIQGYILCFACAADYVDELDDDDYRHRGTVRHAEE